MNSWKIICFFLTILFPFAFSSKDDLTLLIKVISIVFSAGKICFVHDHSSISQVLEKALIESNITVNSISVKHLTSIPLILKDQQGCSDALVVVDHADTFLKPIFEQKFKKQISDFFHPHTRMIVVYEKASNISQEMLMSLAYDFAIDVFTVQKLGGSSKFSGVGGIKSGGLLMKSLYRNETILSVNTFTGNVEVDWSDFERKNWAPRFAPGFVFRISVFHCPPLWYVKNGTLRKGVESRLLDEIIKGWPVKYYIEEENSDGDKWNYSLGLLEKRERDLAVCSHWLTRTVNRTVEFSYPVYRVCESFLVKKPQLLPLFTFVFQPFQANVYCAIFVAIVIVRILLASLKQFARWRYSMRQLEVSEGSLGLGSVNTLLVFWMIFLLLFSTYYSAGLTSTCTHPRVSHDVKTLDDMVANKVPWVFEFQYYRDFLRMSRKPTLKALAELLILGHRILNRTKDSAIYTKSYGSRYITELEELPADEWKYYKRLEDCITEYYAGLVLQKHSPFAREFHKVSQRFVETGLVTRLFDKRKRGAIEMLFSKYVDPLGYTYIDFQRMQGVFFLLVLGWFLSLVVFILECCYSRWIE